ncbi:hypothetical protein M422DRAFT_159338 [Sphaerobolus stellatus SS14]|nr:hypothetical protein M422DRAFT_159338 [Sphaerobolus stellatus SS14]
MPSLAPDTLIVITGITGYLASHMGLVSLREGHRVRGTLRTGGSQRIEQLKKAYIEHGIPAKTVESRLEFVEINDFFSETEWIKVLEGADGILHVAFPLDQILAENLVHLSLSNMKIMLEAAKKAKTIRRFVYTSSSTAIITAPMYVERSLTVNDWHEAAMDVVDGKRSIDDEDLKDMKKLKEIVPYAASKAKSERMGLEFVEKERPGFDFISILPNTTFGPLLYGRIAMTSDAILQYLKGEAPYRHTILPQWFVDVRDVAKIHHLALVTDRMAGKRWLAVSEPFGWNQIAAILRKIAPEANVVEDYEGGEIDRQKFDNAASTELLGGWISLQDSIRDMVENFKKLGLS